MQRLASMTTLALAVNAMASPVAVSERAACPNIHIFGARETTAPAGYGSAGTFVNEILNAYPGSTAEAINYPAQGGTNSAYAASVQAGTQDIANQVNTFHQQCPTTKLVLVGYSQGAQIEDNALCGGGDPNQGITSTSPTISSSAAAQIKVIIWAGNPRNSPAETFHYGTCTAGGFDPRPSDACSAYSSIIRSYCDAADPYCCNGDDASVHQGYGSEYGQNALAFVQSKLS